MGRNSTWSADQTQYLIENVEKLTDSQIANFVQKTIHAVRKHRLRLGLKKANGRGICRLASKPVPASPELMESVKSRVDAIDPADVAAIMDDSNNVH
jgi:hypothetical protein